MSEIDDEQPLVSEGHPSPQKDDDSDDGWQVRTWDLFIKLAKKGVLSPEDFVQFAKDLNVECDALLVRKFMRPEQQDKITFDAALRLLENIPLGNADNESVTGVAEDATEDVVELGVFEYIRVVLCGGVPPPDTKYRDAANVTYQMRLPQPSPQFWLVFNASMVFTIVLGCIIALTAVVWLDTNTSLNVFYAERYQHLLVAFANSFTENALTFSSNDLKDQTNTFALWMDRDLQLRGNDTIAALSLEAATFGVVIEKMAQQAIDFELSLVTVKVSSIEGAAAVLASAAGWSLPQLAALVELWSATSQWSAIIYDPDRNVTYHRTSDVTIDAKALANHPCSLANAASAQANGFSGSAANTSFIGNLSNRDAFSAYTYIRRVGATVCVGVSSAVWRRYPLTRITTAANTANEYAKHRSNANGEDRPFPEILVSTLAEGADEVVIQSTPLSDGRCAGDCISMLQFVKGCGVDRCTMRNFTMPSYDGYLSHGVVMYLPISDVLIALVQSDEALLGVKRHQFIDTMNALQQNLNPNIVALFGGLEASGSINPMLTQERYPERCVSAGCARLPDYNTLMYQAFATGQSTSMLRPNASFRPVIAAASRIQALGLIFTTEKSLEASNTESLGLLASAIDVINGQIDSRTEIQLIMASGDAPLPQFDPATPCGSDELCQYVNGTMVFRSSCPYCVSANPLLASTLPMYISQLRWDTCKACNSSNQVQPLADNSLAHRALTTLSTKQSISFNGRDYAGTDVYAIAAPIVNFSAVLLVKVDRSSVQNSVLQYILIFIAVAILLILVGLLALIVFSQRTLAKIENEWRTFKIGIEAEKTKFDEMIQELIPAPVIARHRAHVTTVTETHSNLSFAFIDLCNFSEKAKSWSPRLVVRAVAYFFHLYDLCGSKFDVFRLRSFGDVAVYVAGLERVGDETQLREAVTKDAFEMGKFAAYITQLLSPAFSHYPHRLPQFADSAKHQQNAEDAMPVIRCRIGLHNGPAHSGLIDVGKTPFYELYGPSLAICQRMQATAQVGRVNVSANFKELIESIDSASVFEFDVLRKTVVKGRGAISSYPIKSIQLGIDEVLLHQLKIEHAQRMHSFANKHHQGGGSAAQEASELSSDIGGSVAIFKEAP